MASNKYFEILIECLRAEKEEIETLCSSRDYCAGPLKPKEGDVVQLLVVNLYRSIKFREFWNYVTRLS